ncbi:MAG TPA: hypothetical protein VL020_02845 [Pseudomonadales bacterium]|nr:hypothetical protein [Pseudomonadales bacterium]
MDIQIYCTTVNIEAENGVSNVLLRGVDLSMLIGQLNVEEVLEAIQVNGNYSDIFDYVAEVEKDKED